MNKFAAVFLIGLLKAAEGLEAPPAPVRGNATELIKYFEGFKPQAYTLPKETAPTVGYGTHLTPDKANIFKRLFGQSVNFDAVAGGQQAITPQQGSALVGDHLTSVSNRLQKVLPSLPKYNPELQGALLNGAYRGDVMQSPKALKLMNQGNWPAASQEYLNNREYKTTTLPGVKTRMNYNASVFNKQPAQVPR